MAYTKENFEEWIILIDSKMEYFTDAFAGENSLKLDYSIESLDEIENCILGNYSEIKDLIGDAKILDYLTVYIGETFRKYICGEWFIDLKNKKNAYYPMPVLTSLDYIGESYIASMTFATACINRKKGNYISTILKNCLEENQNIGE